MGLITHLHATTPNTPDTAQVIALADPESALDGAICALADLADIIDPANTGALDALTHALAHAQTSQLWTAKAKHDLRHINDTLTTTSPRRT